MNYAGTERRKKTIRRDLNDLVRSPDGKVAEVKLWSNVGKFIAAVILVVHLKDILPYWDALAVLLAFLIIPDVAKKMIVTKAGGGSNGATK